jgi:hypothetical protein
MVHLNQPVKNNLQSYELILVTIIYYFSIREKYFRTSKYNSKVFCDVIYILINIYSSW